MNHDGPVLEFEKPVYELEKRIEEMRNFAVTENYSKQCNIDTINQSFREITRLHTLYENKYNILAIFTIYRFQGQVNNLLGIKG